MTMRKVFDRELQQVKDKLLRMGILAEIALGDAIDSLTTGNLALAEQVMHKDQEINQIDKEIESLVVKIISSQQPVATDLRKLIAALKISTSLERIGDFAVDIALTTKRIGTEKFVILLPNMQTMTQLVQEMIREGLQAYIEEDSSLAEQMAAKDDQVDQLYELIFQQIIHPTLITTEQIEEMLHIALIARYLERVADHCTNIAEAILYIVKGKQVDLN